MTTASAASAGNIPAAPNSFIGRERDIGELTGMLGRVRAVTLCGPGGIGKTRLALRLAAALGPGYPDGAWFADLADVQLAGPSGAVTAGEAGHAERLVVALVTAALGIRAEPDRPLADTLTEALRPRTMLLILDTCEHLVQACAEFVQRLLADCQGLRVIATSREPLRVRGEVIWRVPPLSLPPASTAPPGPGATPRGGLASGTAPADIDRYEAVRLFVERAAAVRPGFSLDAANVAAVARICRTLDGVPLAVELAAARVRTLSPEQLSARLADRFELLAHGDRTAPPRLRTLRAAVEWSCELLSPGERTLLRRLSVFHGWSLEMAEQVCADEQMPAADVLGLLTALIDKSLVILDGELNGSARYRLLDTVRELAAEQAAAAGELGRLRVAHRDCMLGLAEGIAAVAFRRGDPPWPERVAMYHRARAERANINLALACCVQRGDASDGLRLCHALAGSFLASGEADEGAGWIDQLLAIDADVAPGVRARALAVRAELAFEQQDYRGARDQARACLELSRSARDGNPAAALRVLALADLMAGRGAEALALAGEALTAAGQMADEWEAGVALATRAVVLASQGSLTEAELAYRQALDVLRDNNGWGVANVLYGLGQVAWRGKDPVSAAAYFGDALAIYDQIEAGPEMARCLAGIGWIALAEPDLDRARRSLTESMRLSLATGHRLAIARGLQALAALESASGDLALAMTLAGASQALFEAIGTTPSPSAAARLERLLDTAVAELGAEAVAALLDHGRELSPYEAALLGAAEPGSLAAPEPGGERQGTTELTGRELEVAALAAQGLSNRAIGEQLFISQTTVARHVANIFGKLGFSSRAQLVAWMAGRERGGGEQG